MSFLFWSNFSPSRPTKDSFYMHFFAFSFFPVRVIIVCYFVFFSIFALDRIFVQESRAARISIIQFDFIMQFFRALRLLIISFLFFPYLELTSWLRQEHHHCRPYDAPTWLHEGSEQHRWRQTVRERTAGEKINFNGITLIGWTINWKQ